MHFKKTIILIFLLLFILLSSGFSINKYLKNTSSNLGNNIVKLQETLNIAKNTKSNQTNSNDTKMVNATWNEFHQNWSAVKAKWSIIMDHLEIDNIEKSISKIDLLIQTDQFLETLVESAILKHAITHIYEKEKLNFKNIF